MPKDDTLAECIIALVVCRSTC